MSTTTQDEDQEEPTIQEQEEEDTRTALYTETGVGAKKFEGWSDAGIERYNKICEDIKVDRDNMMAVEEQYLKQRVEQNNFKIQRKRRQGINGNQRRVAFDEMSRDEEEEEEEDEVNSANSETRTEEGEEEDEEEEEKEEVEEEEEEEKEEEEENNSIIL